MYYRFSRRMLIQIDTSHNFFFHSGGLMTLSDAKRQKRATSEKSMLYIDSYENFTRNVV